MFIPKGLSEVVKIEIYSTGDIPDPGYWNQDNNKVLLSNNMYSEYSRLKTQAEQKKFFDKLIRVSNQQLTF